MRILAKLGRELHAGAAFDLLPKLKVWVVTWPLLGFLERFLVKLPPEDMNLTTAVVIVLTRCQALGYARARSHSILNTMRWVLLSPPFYR